MLTSRMLLPGTSLSTDVQGNPLYLSSGLLKIQHRYMATLAVLPFEWSLLNVAMKIRCVRPITIIIEFQRI